MINPEPGIRDILANNIKENRRKCGFSQEKLAEKAGISTPFLAMIEVSRKFPTPSVLDRLAEALNIKTYQLFAVLPSPDEAMERIHQSIVRDIEHAVVEAVERVLSAKLKGKPLSPDDPAGGDGKRTDPPRSGDTPRRTSKRAAN